MKGRKGGGGGRDGRKEARLKDSVKDIIGKGRSKRGRERKEEGKQWRDQGNTDEESRRGGERTEKKK